eukprot:GHUV01001508.1.p1 GENE.GHUV01001508.1~~GHUV01001508.1.p1  ORF type:complete len:394 (+),score=120.99 GHUV01001508.1:421-1602(+)
MDPQAAAAGPLRQERICPDCGGLDFVEDHARGDIVCKGCGLVAEAHIIDERSEWRTFGDKEKEGDDPSRVGAASNPMMDDAGLSTGIGKMQGGGGQYTMLSRLQNRQNAGDRTMQTAMREINVVIDRMRLTDAVKNSAYEVFKDVQDTKATKGRSLKAVYAACIYVAAKRENCPRTFKEICGVMPDVNKVDIGRCFTAIDKMYKSRLVSQAKQRGEDLAGAVEVKVKASKTAGNALQAVDIIKRFMNRLGADKQLALFGYRVGLHSAELSDRENVPWSSRDPTTQALALIYGVMHIHKLKNVNLDLQAPDFEALAEIGGMAPQTIRDAFKQMLPYFRKPGKLVPLRDANAEVLDKMEEAVLSSDGKKQQEEKNKKQAAKTGRAVTPVPGTLKQ